MHTSLPDPGMDQRQGAESRRRRHLAWVMLAALLVIMAAVAVHWFQRMQYREVTQEAIVEGKLVPLSAPVAGSVLAIGADQHERIKAGQALVELKGMPSHAIVSAPQAGVVVQRLVQVGEQVAAGARLMVIVPLSEMWVTARFRQSQLGRLATGQAVTLTTSSYGRDVRFHGTVVNWDDATVEPAQRKPVRISLDPNELVAHPLQPGLRMRVSVDTRS